MSQVSSLYNQPQQRIINQPQSIQLSSTKPKAPLPGEAPVVEENVRIIKDYVRPKGQGDTVMVRCEICNKNFPKTQINEHIQLELQDPKYYEIKQEVTERGKNTTMAQGDLIAQHLAQLKKKRPDIFNPQDDEDLFRDERKPSNQFEQQQQQKKPPQKRPPQPPQPPQQPPQPPGIVAQHSLNSVLPPPPPPKQPPPK